MIQFKKIQENDLHFLNEVRNLYAEEFLHDSRCFSINETHYWFNKFNPDYWIIWNDNKRIGYFRLSNHSKENFNIYVGADIHPDFIGQGLGYKSYKEFLNFLFNDPAYELNKVSLEVLATNERALHLYKKLGFIYEGCKRQEVLKNNMYIDSIIMSILKQEWNKKNF